MFWSVALLSALTATAWLSGTAIGERLAQHQFSRVNAGLLALETFSRDVALTLQKQGLCLDAPPFESASQHDEGTRIRLLRDQLAVQAPCVDLAIAQSQFATLQMETVTLHLIEQKRSLTDGFIADSIHYRSRPHPRRSEPRKP